MTFKEAKQKKKEDMKRQRALKKKNVKLSKKRWKLRRTLCNKINCEDCPFESSHDCVAFGASSDFTIVENWIKATLAIPGGK